MIKLSFRLAVFFMHVLAVVSCTTARKITQPESNISKLKFINAYTIPFNLQYSNSTVGGLSGIDYDADEDVCYLISDDRSERNPARFYTSRLFISEKGIDSLKFTGINYLKQPNGEHYPGVAQNKYLTPDPEAIRYYPRKKLLVWSNEGERTVKPTDTILTNPAIVFMNLNGTFKDSFTLPVNLQMSYGKKGPRKNGVFEGLTFAENYNTLFASVEEPLYEDGPRADIEDNNALIRIIKFNVNHKKATAQYAYKLDPVAHPADPAHEFKVNGVSEILSIGHNKLLVVERSFSTGRAPCTIKVFIADLSGATDISSIPLEGNKDFTPVKKSLLLNMDDLGIYTDNIEGVTFGPLLPNGNRSLIFIADNNFNFLEQAQVLLFEILE